MPKEDAREDHGSRDPDIALEIPDQIASEKDFLTHPRSERKRREQTELRRARGQNRSDGAQLVDEPRTCLVVLEGCADLYAPELSEPGGEDESDEECRTRGHPEA